MKKAIICHGGSMDFDYASKSPVPSCSKNWLPWLQQRFLLSGVNCQNPAFLHSWVPERTYEDDVKVFSRYEIDQDTALIGHSCGGGFLLRWLSANSDVRIKHLVLVAPWLDGHNVLGNYFDFKLDKNLSERVGRMDLFYSTDDPAPFILESFDKVQKTYPKINIHKFTNKGHWTESEMKTIEFPELWEVCKAQI